MTAILESTCDNDRSEYPPFIRGGWGRGGGDVTAFLESTCDNDRSEYLPFIRAGGGRGGVM